MSRIIFLFVFMQLVLKSVYSQELVTQDMNSLLTKNDHIVDSLDALIVMDPQNPELYFLRAKANSEMMQIHNALIDIEKAKSLNPNDSLLYDILIIEGNSLCARSANALGEQSYRKALNLDEQRPEAYESIVMYYMGRNDNDGAIRFLNNSIDRFPDNPDLLLMRCLYYLRIGKHKKCEAELSYTYTFLDTNDLNIMATYYLLRGRYNLETKNFKKARNDFEEVVSIKSNSAGVYGFLGEACYHLQSYDDALFYLETSRNGGNIVPRRDIYLAEIYEMNDMINEACELYTFQCNFPHFNISPEIEKACKRMKKLKCNR